MPCFYWRYYLLPVTCRAWYYYYWQETEPQRGKELVQGHADSIGTVEIWIQWPSSALDPMPLSHWATHLDLLLYTIVMWSTFFLCPLKSWVTLEEDISRLALSTVYGTQLALNKCLGHKATKLQLTLPLHSISSFSPSCQGKVFLPGEKNTLNQFHFCCHHLVWGFIPANWTSPTVSWPFSQTPT